MDVALSFVLCFLEFHRQAVNLNDNHSHCKFVLNKDRLTRAISVPMKTAFLCAVVFAFIGMDPRAANVIGSMGVYKLQVLHSDIGESGSRSGNKRARIFVNTSGCRGLSGAFYCWVMPVDWTCVAI